MLLALKCPTATQNLSSLPHTIAELWKIHSKKTAFLVTCTKKRQFFDYNKLRRKEYEQPSLFTVQRSIEICYWFKFHSFFIGWSNIDIVWQTLVQFCVEWRKRDSNFTCERANGLQTIWKERGLFISQNLWKKVLTYQLYFWPK